MMEKNEKNVSGKRKRVSKKNKSSWRKHSDIKDIENFLEDQRRQERTGGLVSEKTNDELFFVDSAPNLSLLVNQNDHQDAELKKKRSRQSRALKCHSSLLPDPNIKPARVSTNLKVGVKSTPKWKKEKLANGVVSKKRQQASKQRAEAKAEKIARRKVSARTRSIVTYDLWETTETTKDQLEEISEYHEKTCKLTRVQPPPFYHAKPSVVSTVEVAPPGASYNPTYLDHQNLLAEALKVERKRTKEEKRIHRALAGKFPTADEAPNDKTWLKEMSCGLPNFGNDDEKEEIPEFTEEELSRLSNNPAVTREDKKTEKERKKSLEQKQKVKAAAQSKQENIRKQEIFKLRSIKREIKSREAKLAARQAALELKKEQNKEKPKKLGKLRFTPPMAELKLSKELEGSLRLLKPEGHVLEDRFKSLQKRNIIEPRMRARRSQKYKVKEFEKKGHKAVAE